MKFTRREFIRGGVAAFTVGFAAPAFLSDLARAQGASRRNLVVLYLSRRQRRAEHAGSLHGPVLRQPPPDTARAWHQRASDRRRQVGRRARTPSAADRAQADVRRGAPGADPAHRVSELEPVALHRHGHLDTANPSEPDRRGLARPLSRHSAVAGRSAGRLGDDRAKCRARSSGDTVSVPAIPNPADYAFANPERHRHRGRRSPRTAMTPHRLAPAGRKAASVVRQRHGAGRARDARSRRQRRNYQPSRASSIRGNAAGPGVARGGRRDLPRHRHEGLLGPDRRLRHARDAEHERGQCGLREPDGHAQHGAHDVLQRSPQPGRCCRAP